jgi:hypothetical protein
MKTVLAFATLVCLSAGSAFAADNQVADQTLAKMGLGNMKVMSDEQGMQVRGMALVSVSGYSAAHNRNGEAYNQYSASGFSYAKGGSISFVGTLQHRGSNLTVSGGGAFAAAR